MNGKKRKALPDRSPRLLTPAGGITALALLLAGLAGIVLFIAGDAGGMARDMLRFAPPERTGLPEDLYPALARHLTDYLTGAKDSFQYFPETPAGSAALFHDYELLHMADCRRLIALDRAVCLGGVFTAAAGLALLPFLGPEDRRRFARGGLRGLGFCAAATAALTVWALVNFDGLFVTFHRLAFRNDLWLLDPRTDLLIRLMPEPLFIRLGLRGLTPALGWLLLLTLGFRIPEWIRKG